MNTLILFADRPRNMLFVILHYYTLKWISQPSERSKLGLIMTKLHLRGNSAYFYAEKAACNLINCLQCCMLGVGARF